ncbi:SRPBCC family protein [Streptomyces longwoodensis]|uniref:SRPBCC family protein n=1 Tax=Streptomyces longwoodensis TaxID=68231 RepID=UPI000A90289F|nr:SRPBCC family protein [Streptomyces longwoodensis]MCX5000807.1 SRPBCC family protein [Streptomyces longwoodensis]WRY92768.1 SRPBCC family protein [Streptomyces longwoodensis]WUC55691.1 SRPBCC family protein [Streptomyces longwoodensis]WUC62189.1 SRPBCC family protein [Streptomyces longwoodensis]
MNIDIANQIAAIARAVARLPGGAEDAGECVGVSLRRTYDSAVEDVWDAVTDPDRIKRWFMPISGDLRVGGTFQLEGNAGGEILACEPPRLVRLTWGGPRSIVELRLVEDGDGTALELDHTVPIEMAQSGAGALWVGPGWDGALMGLSLFLSGESIGDPTVMAASGEVQAFSKESVGAWAAAVDRSGTATADQLAQATTISLAQFAPDLAVPDTVRRSDPAGS